MKNSDKNQNLIVDLGFLIFMVILGLVLFATNPTMDDFKQYAKNEFVHKAYEEGEFFGVMSELLKGPAWFLLESYTKRTDYYLLSIYTIEVDDSKGTYLGILNHFWKIGKNK